MCIFLKFKVLCKESHIFKTYCGVSNYYRISCNHLRNHIKLL
ncbi:hypothetical protein B7L44_15215 [Acinetobacter nosocomialis]|nr:hypothetical protein B7L44_15215 [Acinetobacter nosocomialis]OTL14702.1 hypothetical protein B9X80_08425 [Acinetobacter nosocomialis]